jgi:hypothetical protein
VEYEHCNTNSTDKATRPRQQCSVRCQPSPERRDACYRVDWHGSCERGGQHYHCRLATTANITLSGVREAHSGGTSGCDTWHSSNMGRTFDPEPTQRCGGPSLPDLFIVRVFDLGRFYSGCPRYDFSHFNRPWTRICQGASFIVILLPIAKITIQTRVDPRQVQLLAFGRFSIAYYACLCHSAF